jgi:putative oxidoreductase
MNVLKRLISTRPDDTGAAIARIALGAVMFPHGAQKALGWFKGEGPRDTLGMFKTMGIPRPLGGLAIAAEFAGALGLVTGSLGRLAALGVASNMLGAIRLVHQPHGFFMNWKGNQKGEGFEYHLLALGLATVVLVRGSGALSLDALLMRGKEREEKGLEKQVEFSGELSDDLGVSEAAV